MFTDLCLSKSVTSEGSWDQTLSWFWSPLSFLCLVFISPLSHLFSVSQSVSGCDLSIYDDARSEKTRPCLPWSICLIEQVLSGALWERPLTSAQEGAAPCPLTPGTTVILVTLLSADPPAYLLHQTVKSESRGTGGCFFIFSIGPEC